jgi:hypothetical protein
MPEERTMKRAQAAKREGKAPSTQAGEFIREEMHHIREGKHGARSTKQAIAIGLSKARRAGVKLRAPKRGRASAATRRRAARDYQKGQRSRPQAFRATRAGDDPRARTRGPRGRLAEIAVAASASQRSATECTQPVGSGQEGSPHTRTLPSALARARPPGRAGGISFNRGVRS